MLDSFLPLVKVLESYIDETTRSLPAAVFFCCCFFLVSGRTVVPWPHPSYTKLNVLLIAHVNMATAKTDAVAGNNANNDINHSPISCSLCTAAPQQHNTADSIAASRNLAQSLRHSAVKSSAVSEHVSRQLTSPPAKAAHATAAPRDKQRV